MICTKEQQSAQAVLGHLQTGPAEENMAILHRNMWNSHVYTENICYGVIIDVTESLLTAR